MHLRQYELLWLAASFSLHIYLPTYLSATPRPVSQTTPPLQPNKQLSKRLTVPAGPSHLIKARHLPVSWFKETEQWGDSFFKGDLRIQHHQLEHGLTAVLGYTLTWERWSGKKSFSAGFPTLKRSFSLRFMNINTHSQVHIHTPTHYKIRYLEPFWRFYVSYQSHTQRDTFKS